MSSAKSMEEGKKRVTEDSDERKVKNAKACITILNLLEEHLVKGIVRLGTTVLMTQRIPLSQAPAPIRQEHQVSKRCNGKNEFRFERWCSRRRVQAK
ncbi:hypothetical protein HPP92_009828 [Vanilla planifolia]|uniref:Uncharacterized protein n=1 Tax=Vanilla planifolia TaxID=51239 RepID=A0A835R7A3_VANPL|nr:hypothetical protein HPP92_009828 [Vanilla planifolia]